MTGPIDQNFTAILSCCSLLTGEPHTLTFPTAPPMRGDDVWCHRCRAMSTVASAPYEWRADCLSCAYRQKRADTSRTYADHARREHLRSYPGHRTALRNDGVIAERFPARDDSTRRAFADLREALQV